MPNLTPRLSLSQQVGTDTPAQIRLSDTNNTSTLDNAAIYQEGTLVSRPAAGATNHGYLWRTTDSNKETLAWSDGSLWLPIGLIPVDSSVDVTVQSGQCVITTGGGNRTITLPSHTSGQMVGIVNAVAVNVATTVSGTAIFGVGLSSATSFTLGTIGASAVLIDDGTNWNFVSGQLDTGWVALTPASNVNTTGRTPAARQIGDRVWFRGGLTNNTGSPITAGGAIATINSPVTAPPSTTFLNFQGLGATWVQVTTGNAIQGSGSSFASSVSGYLDGLSYSIT